MNALQKQVAQHLNTTAQHIAISKRLREDMDKTKPLYDKATPKEQQAIRMKFAQLIGKENGVVPKITTQGNVGFDRNTRKGDAARKMLNYYFPTKKKDATPTPKVSKQLDPVQQLVKKFKALTPSEKRRFLASL